jgi:hypothetical protein
MLYGTTDQPTKQQQNKTALMKCCNIETILVQTSGYDTPFVMVNKGAAVFGVYYVGSVIITTLMYLPYQSMISLPGECSNDTDRVMARSVLLVAFLVSICASINVISHSVVLLLGIVRIRRHVYVIILWMGICFDVMSLLLYGWAIVWTMITTVVKVGRNSLLGTDDVHNNVQSNPKQLLLSLLSLNFPMMMLP